MAIFLGYLPTDTNITYLVGQGFGVLSVCCGPSSAWHTSLGSLGIPSWSLPHFSDTLLIANISSMNFQETGDKHPQKNHFSTLDTYPPATRIKPLLYNYYILLFIELWLCGRLYSRYFIHISSNPLDNSLRVRLASFKGRGSVILTIMFRITQWEMKSFGFQTTVLDSHPWVPSMQYLPHCQFQLKGSLDAKQVELVYWRHCHSWLTNSPLLPVRTLHILSVPASALGDSLHRFVPSSASPHPPCSVWKTEHTVICNMGYCTLYWLLEYAPCSPQMDGHVPWAFHFPSPHSSSSNHHHWNQYHLLIFCHTCVRHPAMCLTSLFSNFTSAL